MDVCVFITLPARDSSFTNDLSFFLLLTIIETD